MKCFIDQETQNINSYINKLAFKREKFVELINNTPQT